MPNTIVDTCIWLAFVDEREAHNRRGDVDAIYDLIHDHSIVMPWPVAYETLRTRLARRHIALSRVEIELKSPRIGWIDDTPYRQQALELTFQAGVRERRPLSMVDCLIRLMLDDRNLNIDYLATWNDGDFDDVCRKRRIEIIG